MSESSITSRLENWDESRPLTREEAVEILNLPEEEMPKLLDCAYALRTKYKGKKVSVQLLTNVRSGNCSQNCAYCAQSRDSEAPIEKYRRVSDEKLYGDNDEEKGNTDLLFHRIFNRETGKNFKRSRTGSH